MTKVHHIHAAYWKLLCGAERTDYSDGWASGYEVTPEHCTKCLSKAALMELADTDLDGSGIPGVCPNCGLSGVCGIECA